MKNSNPTVIPRNHKIEKALRDVNQGNLEILNKLLSILNKPYDFKMVLKIINHLQLTLNIKHFVEHNI